MNKTRIRQLVFASRDHGDIARLQRALGLGTPYVDPGVGHFGLTNGVFALGDQFLEVVVPIEDNTAAGRFLDRSNGTGGYMAIFQTDDIAAVRQRADKAGIRRVWNADHDEIIASHMHPADLGGAIVSVDEPHPPASWLWGGPDWSANSVPGAIVGAQLTAPDPQALAGRWAGLLGLDLQEPGTGLVMPTEDGPVEYVSGDTSALVAFNLALPDPAAALARAATEGFDVSDDSFFAMGVRVCLTSL